MEEDVLRRRVFADVAEAFLYDPKEEISMLSGNRPNSGSISRWRMIPFRSAHSRANERMAAGAVALLDKKDLDAAAVRQVMEDALGQGK